MTPEREAAGEALDELISRLDHRRYGKHRNLLTYVRELRALVADPSSTFDGPAHHLLRWLDHDGIVDGPIFERGSRVQQALYEVEVAEGRAERGDPLDRIAGAR